MREMLLAARNLFTDKTRLALSVGGVALAVMLILLLNGMLDGTYRQISAYLDHTPGSVVVAQDGVNNLLGASSLLPGGTAAAARANGAATVVPILSQFIILDLHGEKVPVYLVGYDRRFGGGPWRLAAGREPRRAAEIVFDRVLAQRHGLALGDKVEIMERDFSLAGLSDGTTSWMTSFVFVRASAAEELLGAPPGAASFLLVSPRERLTADGLRLRLNRLGNVEALHKSAMIANDVRLFSSLLSAPLRLMVSIAFLVGTLVVGLVIYTATVERQREYGVLKAMGARNAVLYRTVAAQAVIASDAGAGAGVALAYLAAELIMRLRPQFLIVLEPGMIGRAVLIGLAMALVAALFPVRLIAGLAPAEVFRK